MNYLSNIGVVEAFKCELCNEVFPEIIDAKVHVKECLVDQKRIRKEKLEAKQLEKIQNSVRLEADNLEHAIELIRKNAWKNYGLRVTFEEYPKELTDVSNTHGAPIGLPTNWGGLKKKDPRSYLGFSGRWKGKIKGRCKYNGHERYEDTELSCLFAGSFSHGYEGFFSGTGCPAKEFDIDGYLFVDDFPKWKEPKGIIDLLSKITSMDNFKLIKASRKVYQRFLKHKKGLSFQDLVVPKIMEI